MILQYKAIKAALEIAELISGGGSHYKQTIAQTIKRLINLNTIDDFALAVDLTELLAKQDPAVPLEKMVNAFESYIIGGRQS